MRDFAVKEGNVLGLSRLSNQNGTLHGGGGRAAEASLPQPTQYRYEMMEVAEILVTFEKIFFRYSPENSELCTAMGSTCLLVM